MTRITVSECADMTAMICAGCRREHLYEEDGIGCTIQFEAECCGEVPKQWAGGVCTEKSLTGLFAARAADERRLYERRMAGDWS